MRGRTTRVLQSCILALLLALAAAGNSYYDVLGVPKSASQSQIKAAFRRLSKQHHPDVSSDPNSVEKFQEITEAYEVLSDADQRKIYDRHGKEGLKQRQQQGHGSPFGNIELTRMT